jgi:hypothetical protein
MKNDINYLKLFISELLLARHITLRYDSLLHRCHHCDSCIDNLLAHYSLVFVQDMIGDHLIDIAGIRSLSINNTAYDLSIFYNVNINYGISKIVFQAHLILLSHLHYN